MSQHTVITDGFGTFGSHSLVITEGYSIQAIPSPFPLCITISKQTEYEITTGKQKEYGITTGKQAEYGITTGNQAEYGITTDKQTEYEITISHGECP